MLGRISSAVLLLTYKLEKISFNSVKEVLKVDCD